MSALSGRAAMNWRMPDRSSHQSGMGVRVSAIGRQRGKAGSSDKVAAEVACAQSKKSRTRQRAKFEIMMLAPAVQSAGRWTTKQWFLGKMAKSRQGLGLATPCLFRSLCELLIATPTETPMASPSRRANALHVGSVACGAISPAWGKAHSLCGPTTSMRIRASVPTRKTGCLMTERVSASETSVRATVLLAAPRRSVGRTIGSLAF